MNLRIYRSLIVPCLFLAFLELFLRPVTANSQTARFAYVANGGSGGPGTVSAYTIDATTGALTPIPGSPFPAGSLPRFVTVDPSGRFLYVPNSNSNNISAYTIDATTGALTPIPGSPFVIGTGTQPVELTVDPSGRFTYVTDTNNNDVLAYTIDGTTGALTQIPGSPFAAGAHPIGVVVDNSGKFAYVTNGNNGGSGSVSAYTIDPSTGALTPIPGSPFQTGGAYAFDPTVNPSGQFAYVTNGLSNSVSAYTIDKTSGALTAISGSPFPAGGFPDSVRVDPSGRFAYVASGFDDDVWAYTINAATGALTPIPGSPFAAGTTPQGIAVDHSGEFAYITNVSSNDVWAYAIDGTTGALTPIPGSPFSAGANPVAVTTSAGTHSSLVMGPQAMEGNLSLSPGTTLEAGYDFTMPGNHPSATVSFIGANVTFTWTCVSGPGSGTLVVPMADQSYTDAQNSPNWYPSGDQHSPLVYQGSIAVPNVCSGGPVSFQAGGTFSTSISSTDTQDKVNVRWHYSGDGSAGGWSATKSVVP